MKGTRIQVTSPTRGVLIEGFIATGQTPKPGTVMEIDPGVAEVGGRFTWQPYGVEAASGGRGVGNDGDRKIIAILLEKRDEFKTYDDAYAAGDRCWIYFPIMGEEFNMIIENQSGTGEDFAIGDELMVDDGTGKLLECDDNAEAHPFTCLEVQSALTADVHSWVRFNGSAG